MRLVDQFLELRRIDAGKMVLEAQQDDLVALVKDIVSDFNIKAKSMNIDLQFICHFETLPFYFDAEKLDKVFFNIISNAFKYTPKGGLIHVTLLKNVDKIDIIIADNGTGITQEEKNMLLICFIEAIKKHRWVAVWACRYRRSLSICTKVKLAWFLKKRKGQLLGFHCLMWNRIRLF